MPPLGVGVAIGIGIEFFFDPAPRYKRPVIPRHLI